MISKKHIPNILTGARGVLTIVITVLFLIDYDRYIIVIWLLFITASLTDLCDGYCARRWNAVSKFGKITDPLFDKILIFSLLILVFEFEIVPKFFVIILIVRDLFIDTLRNYLFTTGTTLSAILSAKIKTAFQILMINFILLTLIFPTIYTLQKIAIATGAIAIILSLWSAGVYIRSFCASLRQSQ